MFRAFTLLIALLAFTPAGAIAAGDHERPDWARHFDESGAQGTMVVLDARDEPATTSVHGKERAVKRYSPASTFKIPHTLIALDAGVIRDEFQVIRWDGVIRGYEPWNGDQNLRSAMRHSAVWVYQRFARDIGLRAERQYLRNIGYGNADASGGSDGFWLDGNLRISAYEQIAFLKRLYRNELPFREEHQRLVKDLMVMEAGRDWILRAKTGWDGQIGWWVGWVEQPAGPVFFALNIDTPGRTADLHKREAVARTLLRSIKALPQ